MPRRKFSQDAVAEMFSSYLTQNEFKPLPHGAGNRAMEEILNIDYRGYLLHPRFKDIYAKDCESILMRNGSSRENAEIFTGAIFFVANTDNGFGDAMKEFIDEFVRISTLPPEPTSPDVSEYQGTYGQIMLVGFDPDTHINDDGSFNLQGPRGSDIKFHDPDSGAVISVGVSAALGAFVAVSGPLSPAVLAIGAAVVIGAVVLRKALKKAC